MKFVNIKRRWAIGLALAAISIMAAACGSAASSAPASTSAPALQPPEATEAPAQQRPTATAKATAENSPVQPVSRSLSEKSKTKADSISPETNSAQAHEIAALNPTPGVESDPDYEQKVKAAGISTRGWTTDFTLHTVTFDSIISGGPPRDGIPPLDNPTFTTIDLANEWLDDKEPVISFEINDVARAYPLQILTWHEIVNDVVGDVPVAVTFCPLCNPPLSSTGGWRGWSSISALRDGCATAT